MPDVVKNGLIYREDESEKKTDKPKAPAKAAAAKDEKKEESK